MKPRLKWTGKGPKVNGSMAFCGSSIASVFTMDDGTWRWFVSGRQVVLPMRPCKNERAGQLAAEKALLAIATGLLESFGVDPAAVKGLVKR